MKKLFNEYEIALKLKELGFDEPCFCAYNDIKELSQLDKLQGYSNALFDYVVLAPLYQQVVDWFREKHNIDIVVSKNSNELINYVKEKDPTIDVNSKLYCWYFVEHNGRGSASSFYEALDKAIENALTLISE